MARRSATTHLSEILVFEKPLWGTAQEVAELARGGLDRCDGVGMRLLGHAESGARVSTDTRSSELDTLQDELDEGPCVECLRTGEVRDLEPITADARWPAFAPSARRAGLVACLALPLVADGGVIGTLNLYAWPRVGFAGWDRGQCSAFARHASMLLVSAQAYARARSVIAGLEAQLAAVPGTD